MGVPGWVSPGLVRAGGFGWSLFAGKQGVVLTMAEAACPQGEGATASASAASPREPGAGRTCSALPAACQHPSHPVHVPFPVQISWVHMLYAAIGAIAFTLVS